MSAGHGATAGGGDSRVAGAATPMAKLMGDDTTADCVVVVDGDREYPCHKCILATASAVFRNLLYSQGVKQWESRIKLDGVSVAGWDTLHNYCYKQSVRGRPRL